MPGAAIFDGRLEETTIAVKTIAGPRRPSGLVGNLHTC